MKNKVNIDYIIVGAQKAGTSWITDRFRELPDFEFMPIKEIHHFDRLYQDSIGFPVSLKKRITNYRWLKKMVIYSSIKLLKSGLNFKWQFNLVFKNYNDQWYLNFFKPFKKIKGDNTPCYSILRLEDIKRMYKLCPNAKIIFCMRNPIDRIWSSYRFDLTHEFTKKLNNECEEDFFNRVALSEFAVNRTKYIETIKNYQKVYPQEQIMLTYYDKLIEDPKLFLSEIVDFIGGDVSNIEKYTSLNKISNKSIKSNIPPKYKEKIVKVFKPMMKELSDNYGSYPKKWYDEL